ncbi:MAG: hypothetical protein HKN59_03720 [Gammaproteobacteria bacterium]|nr:hypothetical protein [Gammaproteobacteria bacterium]
MIRITRLTARLATLLQIFGLLLVPLGLPALAQSPSAEQLRMLQQLSPEQREAALELLMDEKLTLSQDEPVESPETIKPRNVKEEPDAGDEESADGDESEQASSEVMLRPFGYDLFAGEPTTFAPATDIPVPVDYIIGPGDTVQVQLFGKDNADYSLVVSRDGLLNFPELGPISVVGLRFQQMKDDLERRIAEQMIGVKASISMGRLRSIRVFVLGDAYRPGSYTVSALSTMTNALFVSGGINDIGSLRKVQLKREGRVVGRLDLYDLLLNGDTRGDVRLQPGDVIFIPPVGVRVGVSGEVRRPALYELRNEKTVAEVLQIAGGMLPTADPGAASIERINEQRERTVIGLDLSKQSGRNARVRPDDLIRVVPVLEKVESAVYLSGHVYREGDYQWRPGMRLSQLIPTTEALLPRADLHYVMIRRELSPDRRIKVISADLLAALAAKGSAADPVLQSRDQVFVFDLSDQRQATIEPILDELRSQSSAAEQTREVGAGGRVKVPGRYPLESNMRVSDLVRAAGGLQESAYTMEAELTRFEVIAGTSRVTEHRFIDLDAILQGDVDADFSLKPYDFLTIKEVPQWRERQVAGIVGEVNFPGQYTLSEGETLRSVLLRAGGLTDIAFPEGAIFVRENVKERERARLEELASRLEGDLTAAALQGAQSSGSPEIAEALALGQNLVNQLKATEPTGRLVIDLRAVLSGAIDADIELHDGDQLFIPRTTQEVTVVGEVQSPTSHLFERGLRRNDYIGRSGGYTLQADKRRTYVVRANGSVVTDDKGSLWFKKKGASGMRPGDTIVVPLDADRVKAITKWANVSQILYQLGLAAASAKTVGIF